MLHMHAAVKLKLDRHASTLVNSVSCNHKHSHPDILSFDRNSYVHAIVPLILKGGLFCPRITIAHTPSGKRSCASFACCVTISNT